MVRDRVGIRVRVRVGVRVRVRVGVRVRAKARVRARARVPRVQPVLCARSARRAAGLFLRTDAAVLAEDGGGTHAPHEAGAVVSIAPLLEAQPLLPFLPCEY